MRIMGKVVDDNCIAILLILAFFLFVECIENFEGFSDYPDSLGEPTMTKMPQKPQPQMELKNDPNIIPKQIRMEAPPSMMDNLSVLGASPIKADGDYLLLDSSLRGLASVDSMKPVSPQVVTDRPTSGEINSVLSKEMKGVGHLENVGIGKMPTMMGNGDPIKDNGKHKEIRLIMIYAPWCGYSKKAKPDFDKMIEKHHGQLKNGTMVKIILYDSEKRKDMVEKYKVRGFPHYVLEIEENDGSVSTKAVNERSFEKLEQIILSNV